MTSRAILNGWPLAAGRATVVTPTPTPTPTPGLLALDRRIVFGDNSYGAQTGNIDHIALAWANAGCRGVPSMGFRQAMGGDRLTHLLDRIAPVKAVRAGLHVWMGPENDLSDGAITGNQAGGDAILARLDANLDAVEAVVSDTHHIFSAQGNATTALGSKAGAATAYNTGLPARVTSRGSRASIFNINDTTKPGGGVDLQDTLNSTDNIHPNKTRATKRLAKSLGAEIASHFVTDDVFANGLTLPNAIITQDASKAWTFVTNSSGITLTQSQGFLRDRPSVPCRVFDFTGTPTQAETTTSGVLPDVVLSYSGTLPVGFTTTGKAFAAIFLLEITNAAGTGPPVGLATMQFTCASTSQTFNKVHTAAHGEYLWDEGWSGPMGVLPGSLLTGQATPPKFEVTLRGKQGVVPDFQIRIAAINTLDTEAVAYGPIATMSRVYTAGHNPLAKLAELDKTTVAVGGTLSLKTLATWIGGGVTHSYDAMRGGTTDVGDITLAMSNGGTGTTSGVPYTTVPGDVGPGIAGRHNASNTFGGQPYADSVLSLVSSVT